MDLRNLRLATMERMLFLRYPQTMLIQKEN